MHEVRGTSRRTPRRMWPGPTTRNDGAIVDGSSQLLADPMAGPGQIGPDGQCTRCVEHRGGLQGECGPGPQRGMTARSSMAAVSCSRIRWRVQVSLHLTYSLSGRLGQASDLDSCTSDGVCLSHECPPVPPCSVGSGTHVA